MCMTGCFRIWNMQHPVDFYLKSIVLETVFFITFCWSRSLIWMILIMFFFFTLFTITFGTRKLCKHNTSENVLTCTLYINRFAHWHKVNIPIFCPKIILDKKYFQSKSGVNNLNCLPLSKNWKNLTTVLSDEFSMWL